VGGPSVRDPGLADWRLVLGRLVATFRAPTSGEAAAVVPRVVEVAPSADVDLRPAGVLAVSLPMDDVGTAEAVSAAAVHAGLVAEPRVAMATEIAIDAMDIAAVRPFWKAVLGYVDDGPDALAHPERLGPAVWFQQMDAPRLQRNRIHVDVAVPADVADERRAGAIEAGGRALWNEGRAFWVLADPEGNEACICTWQDRD
jgi:4a-hydroxytetrahydrobiopterin dehydratase